MNNVPVLFNRKILNKYLSAYSSEQILDYACKRSEIARWKRSIEEGDLLKTKERTVQGKFLVNVFEKILGYETIVSGSAEYNQEAEYTSKLDGTQADGALGFFTAKSKTVRAVIELKDAKTNLDKKQQRSNHLTPVEQAFNYANKNGSGCRWVIVSNFVEIRLYNSSSSLEYEKFLITELDDAEEFKRFFFLLCKENLIDKFGKSVVDKLYDDNEQARKKISNEFYKDYKKLRTDLFSELKHNNSSIDEIILFSKAQKILDRFIFICFCENLLLLPQGIFKSVIEAAKKSFIMIPNRLWAQLNGLFHSIDKGNPPMKINGYNGGLFKQDEILDELSIPDVVLERFEVLTSYDFSSDLNVNILGHIFEQSISDIELVKAEISGRATDSFNNKQKEDGIFYTPDYVTKFIVEKTIGRWINDEKRKIRCELIGGAGFVTHVGKRSKTIKKWEEIPEATVGKGSITYAAIVNLHIAFWERYTERIKEIRVVDPACGSGAFLNQAFDFLAKEGAYAIEMYYSLMGGQMTIFNWDEHILQNSLYGVDLNEESIEITKLSLWLKTARNDRALTALDENIKCGNSIINSVDVAGNHAFDWKKEFPSVMEMGGFDIVIGNPPYGATLLQSEKDYIAANYQTTEYNFDTYKTFMELGSKIVKTDGYMGYITPNTYFVLEKGANKLRKFLFENYTFLNVVELYNVFPTAVVEPAISIFMNRRPMINSVKLEVISVPRKTDLASTFIADGMTTLFEQSELQEKEGYIFNYKETTSEKKLIKKIKEIATPLSEYFNVTTGVKPYQVGKGNPKQTKNLVDNKPFEGFKKTDENWFEYIRGKNINRYTDAWEGEYIKYGEWLAEPRNIEMFQNEKLFVRQTGDYPIATYDASGKVGKNTVHCVYHFKIPKNVSLKYALGLLNSMLMRWVFQHDNFHIVGKPLAETKKVYIERLPIVVADDQSVIITLVDLLLKTYQARFDNAKQFVDYLTAMYSLKSVSVKLSEFYTLNFKVFIGELKNQKIKLTPKQEIELMPLFSEKAKECLELSQTIYHLEKDLDDEVFQLYGLTEEEKNIVKENM
ncbi:MAG: N-6 DNA methylase [Clostridiales bacterium]|nr:N-6 DNA methylase [Clostridiales bacterium]